MMRASSPPEAIFWMGFRSSPTLADMRKRTVSIPSPFRPVSPSTGAKAT